MEDLKKLTVRHLRELARKHLGRGRSKLKTKAELIAALKAGFGRMASKGAASAKVVKPAPAAKAAGSLAAVAKRTTRVKVTAFAGDQQSAASIQRNEGTGPGIAPQRKAEPLIEGFFIARIAGEDEARRHGLTEAFSPRASLNRNGRGAEVSLSEGDDRLHALARDPETLFVFWDFPKKSRDEAARGLKSPRAVLRVFEGDQMVREVEFTPESRSFYVHHLRPGHRYRVEAHLVGLRGQSRQIGFSSNTVELPGRGNLQGDIRLMRLPWEVDLRQDLESDEVHFRTLERDRARDLAARLDPETLGHPRDASSDRRSWLFSPSGRP
jgi:hypothetical protein